jgi:membrane protein
MVPLPTKLWTMILYDPRTAIDMLEKRGKHITSAIIKFIVFWRVIFSEYWLNHCITRASALAFSLLLTLIPLMASLSFMLATMIEVHPKEVERIITIFLPFAPPTVMDHISNFFANAQKLRGIGTVSLVVLAVGLFGAIEESLGTIWKITRPRSFFNQLMTFTMVMVWGPLFFFASFQFRQSGWLDFLPQYFVFNDILPFFLVVLGFTILIWFMPNTKVQFRSAFLGGLIAGSLFELERWGFGAYIRLSIQTRTIYGAYGILPFFLASLFIVSLFILFGAEIAYVHQNFRPLLRSKKRWDRRATDHKTYIALRMVLEIVDAFQKKKTPPRLSHFMHKFELTEPQAWGIIKLLSHEGYIRIMDGKEGFVPAYDLSNTSIKSALDKIEGENRKIPTIPDDYAKTCVGKLIKSLTTCTNDSIEGITFQNLINEIDEGNFQQSKQASQK